MARIKQHFFEEIAGREDSPDPDHDHDTPTDPVDHYVAVLPCGTYGPFPSAGHALRWLADFSVEDTVTVHRVLDPSELARDLGSL